MLCLVVKADAYGHGLVPVSRQALRHGADWLAVATVGEGVSLRDAGIDAPIIILSPILPIEADQALFYDLDITVESCRAVEEISKTAVERGRTARLHLKVDTGLSRFGCRPSEALGLMTQLRDLPNVQTVGVSTHLVDSRGDAAETKRQVSLFRETIEEITRAGLRPEVVHCANSGGAVAHHESRFDMARVGLHAYGLDPTGPSRTVMTLRSRIVAERWIEPGEKVGYQGAWRAERPTRILTIASGYGDGVPRHASNSARIFAGGVECPVVGLICMDLLMIDATDAPEAGIGDAVEIIGRHMHPSRWAVWARSNSHEIVTRIAPRVPRRLINADWTPKG